MFRVFILFLLYINLNGDFIRYSDKEIVIDTKNMLMWQDSFVNKSVIPKYSEVIKYCTNTNHAGYNDWYLPNINELYTIADLNNIPKIKKEFKHIIQDVYFSSTFHDKNVNHGNLVRSFSFNIGDFINFYADQDYGVYFRCVRQIKK